MDFKEKSKIKNFRYKSGNLQNAKLIISAIVEFENLDFRDTGTLNR